MADPSQSSPKISDAEWLVMQVLWDRAPLTGADVADALAAETRWSPRTVKTMLTRLVRKSALRYTEDGNRYLYEPTVQREACIREESRSFVDRVFGGAALPAVEHFVRNEKLTDDEIARLRALLEEQERRS